MSAVVTHRIIRHARRVETIVTLTGDVNAPIRTTEESWEVSCACGDVFRKPDEKLASAAYLAHLPLPTALPPSTRITEGKRS